MVDNTAFISDLYRQRLNRAPDAAGLQYWQDQMAAGMSPNQVVQGISGTQEGQINGLYGSLLERAPDPGGYDYYSERIPQVGLVGARQEVLRSPEYNNRIGDDLDFWRSQARQATAGINAMPGVFSDFSMPGVSRGAPGGLPQLQSLLNFGAAQSQPVVPTLTSLLETAIPELKKPEEAAVNPTKPSVPVDRATQLSSIIGKLGNQDSWFEIAPDPKKS